MGAIECRVINLQRRSDRLGDIGTRLDAAGIAWVRHLATDAAEHDPDSLAARIPGRSWAYPLSHVERACAASHLAAWAAFLAGPAQVLCVLEDDVRFSSDLGTLLADEGWIGPAHGVVKLDANSAKPRRALVSPAQVALPLARHDLWRLWSRRLGGGGYIAHRDVVARLADLHARPELPIDHCLFNPPYAPHFRAPGVHIIEPPLVFHDHAGSDMQGARRDQTRRAGWLAHKFAREVVGIKAIPRRAWAMVTKGARFQEFAP